MKLFGNELIVAFDNKVKNMSNSKPSCSQEKNYKIIEEIFKRSSNTIDSSIKKIKFETNKLLLDSEFSRLKKQLKRLKRKHSHLEINELNKASRVKRLFDLIETSKNEFKPCLPVDETCKSVLSMKALLKVESTQERNNKLVHLTWDVINILNSKKNDDDKMYEMIKEYEIYSYKLNLNPNKSDNDTNCWTKIGTVQPYLPPVKCTLSDFASNCKYFFTVRIKNKQNLKSEFSEPVSIVI